MGSRNIAHVLLPTPTPWRANAPAAARLPPLSAPAMTDFRLSAELNHLFQDGFHSRLVECAQRLGAHVAELSDAQAERGHGLDVGRLQNADHVISAERPIKLLHGRAGLLCRRHEGTGAFR